MCDAVCVRVQKPKSLGRTRTCEVLWRVDGSTIEAIQEICADSRTPETIATVVANSLPLKQLRKIIEEEEKKAKKAYKDPVVLPQEIVLSLKGRQREHVQIELRAKKAGEIEIWPLMPLARSARA